MPSSFVIEVVGLACVRGERALFHELSFRLPSGGVLSVEGPNGAGKTSLLRMIAGFIPPAAGSVAVISSDGRVDDPEERGKLMGWLGHHDAAKSQLTPTEMLRSYAGLYGNLADVAASLDRVGLTRLSELPCQYLSAGQKKRLALARLLICGRAIWLMDEPLAALDEAGKRLAAELIGEHGASGGATIAATHEPLGVASDQVRLGP